MSATRWMGLAFGGMGLLSLWGCGSSASYVGGASKAPAYEATPTATPAQAGYGQSTAGYDAPRSAADGAGATMAPPPPAAAPMQPGAMPMDREEAPARKSAEAERPGLGTEWGETRRSQVTTVPFRRDNPNSPFALGSFFYNDEEGARAMANAAGFRRTGAGTFASANNLVAVGLRDESGRFLSGFTAGGRSYVIGESGRRYSIVVRNNTDFRLEIVLSVDGLDVLDGKPASFAKRGYLIDPRGELEVEGFRQSYDAVAAFRFGSVRDSYAAQKHGDARNVGVIGVAVFNERGTNPFPWNSGEVQRRLDANPFPGQFATPP